MEENFVQSGNLALKSGNKELARSFFRKAVHQDRNNVQAWLGLAASVESDFERVHCLQTVINIEPGNKTARNALDRVVNGLFDDKGTANSLDHSFDQIRATYATSSGSEMSERSDSVFNGDGFETSPFSDSSVFVDETMQFSEEEPFGEEAQAEAQQPVARERKGSGGIPKKIFIWGSAALLVVCVLLAAMSGVMMQIFQIGRTPTPAFMAVAKPVLAQELTQTALAVTPTIGLPTPSPSPTAKPTETSVPTATFQVANPTVEARFKEIRQEVSDLRGLAILNSAVPAYAVNKKEAEAHFYDYVHSEDFAVSLENRKQALVLLGFVKPTFDMLNEVLSHLVDNIGGFYTPGENQIFIVTNTGVGGLEYLVYSHEYDHALVDQHYNIKDMGVYPECLHDAQQCQALEALFEGDATLLMELWAKQFFTEKDYLDAISGFAPFYAAEDEAYPPYLAQDAAFSYLFGRDFVYHFYQSGQWAAVDKLYARPPVSTEQILHIEKYNDNELPVDLPDSELGVTLGENWERIQSDVLGEWMTYLLLAYNADIQSQIDTQLARNAAAGWGGDRYQVFQNKVDGARILAVHWVWDRDYDASEFFSAMSTSLENRFRGNHVDGLSGGEKCWQVAESYSCLYLKGKDVLWLLAPQKNQLEIMIEGYPDFAP